MADKEMQRPEGRLIETAIDTSKIHSRRSVAQGIGISEARVRQIINGYASAGRGQRVEVTAPADTLGKMADHLLLTPEDLEGVGRPDAADFMRNMPQGEGRGYVMEASAYSEAWSAMEEWLRDGSVHASHPPTRALHLFTAAQLAEVLSEMVDSLEVAMLDRGRRQLDDTRRQQKEGSDGQPAPTSHAASGRSDSPPVTQHEPGTVQGEGRSSGETTPTPTEQPRPQ